MFRLIITMLLPAAAAAAGIELFQLYCCIAVAIALPPDARVSALACKLLVLDIDLDIDIEAAFPLRLAGDHAIELLAEVSSFGFEVDRSTFSSIGGALRLKCGMARDKA